MKEHIYNIRKNEKVTMTLDRYENLKSEILELKSNLTKDAFIIYTYYDTFSTDQTGVYKTKEAFYEKLISDSKEKDLKLRELKEEISELRNKTFFQRLFKK